MENAPNIPEQEIEEAFKMAEEALAKIEANPSLVGGLLDEVFAIVVAVLRRWCLGSFPRLDALIARRAAVVPLAPPDTFAAVAHRRRNAPK